MSLENTYTEHELVSLLKKKDMNAFRYLYDKYSPSFYGMIVRNVKHDEEYVQHVLQHSFTQIWKNIETYNHSNEGLFSWMFKVVYANMQNKKEFITKVQARLGNYKKNCLTN